MALQDKLAGYKVPLVSDVFVGSEELARGATGKLHKRNIRDGILKKQTPKARL